MILERDVYVTEKQDHLGRVGSVVPSIRGNRDRGARTESGRASTAAKSRERLVVAEEETTDAASVTHVTDLSPLRHRFNALFWSITQQRKQKVKDNLLLVFSVCLFLYILLFVM